MPNESPIITTRREGDTVVLTFDRPDQLMDYWNQLLDAAADLYVTDTANHRTHRVGNNRRHNRVGLET